MSEPSPDTPRTLIFGAAMTSGMLLALAAHILTTGFGIGLGSVWRTLFTSSADQLRSALGWWIIAGAGFAGSFLAVVVLNRPQRGPPVDARRLPWSAGLALFILLVTAERMGEVRIDFDAPTKVVSGMVALALGTFMAFCGSFYALRR
jgi:hypothetical protein